MSNVVIEFYNIYNRKGKCVHHYEHFSYSDEIYKKYLKEEVNELL